MNYNVLRALHGLVGASLLAIVFTPVPTTAQAPELVYLPNITATTGEGGPLTTIEEQTAGVLDALGEQLRSRGLGYGDVVVMNVFLRDTRHFQAMNGVYRGYFATDPPTRATVEADLPDRGALLQVSAVATPDGTEVISPAGLQSPALPYSWGIRAGDVLFIAGATSRDPDTYQPVRGDVQTQTRRVFGNIGMVLEATGMDYGDLVACKVFLDDGRLWGDMNEAYREFVTADDPPARAAVRGGLMNPDFLVEIQCVAERSDERRVVRREGQQPGSSPLSPAIATGERVWLSGMLAPGDDAEGEARATLGNLGATLEAAGLGLGDVEDVWVYLTDVRDAEAVLGVIAEMMPDGAPVPTIAGLPLVGRLGVEIQMTAVVP
ncbi:MAG: RidA family protein [Gammaproteobacteria bacterium]|nr:RidA family protein [Gammaproteobacteria bacterium]